MDVRDGAIGCVLGLSIGDALGAPFASRRAHQLPDPLPAFELAWMGHPAGSTTAITAMARTLASSLIDLGELDVADVLRRHLEWFRADPRGMESITRRVLARASEGATDPAEEYVRERGPEVSAGNGSVRSCAPLGVAYAGRPDELVALAPALSAITHADERCRTACVAITLVVAALVRGEPGDRAVVDALGMVADLDGGEELEFLVDQAGRARPVDGPDGGFALFTAGLALRVASEGRGFEEGLRYIVSLGGDTGSNAAASGALLGALHGHSGLPRGWLERLQDRDAIEREAMDLAELAQRIL
jgi:ADP-ribosylglycohydrolase